MCASEAQVGNLRLRGRRVTPAHRGTHVGAGFLPARTLRVGNQDVCASKSQVGKPAATGTAGGASAPRDTRRCRFFTCTNATGGKPRGVRERSAGRKPAATGTAGDASAPRDTRRCRFFTCTNATGRKPGRVCEQSAGRKTCGYVGEQKLSAGRKPAATGTEQKHACSRLPAPNSSSRNAWLPRLERRFSGVNAESLRVRPQRVIRCKHPWRVSRRHAMPVLGVAMNSRSRP